MLSTKIVLSGDYIFKRTIARRYMHAVGCKLSGKQSKLGLVCLRHTALEERTCLAISCLWAVFQSFHFLFILTGRGPWGRDFVALFL